MLGHANERKLPRRPTTIRRPADSDDGARQPAESRRSGHRAGFHDSVVAEHDEGEQQTEGQGRHEEEVHGDDLSGMRGEKDPPGRRGPRGYPAHVLGDGQLGDLVTEQGEFCLDAPAASRRILARHAVDQLAELGVEPRAAD